MNPVNPNAYQAMLQDEHRDVTKKGGLYDLVRELREDPNAKYKLSRKRLTSLFESATNWTRVKNSSGHAIFKNNLTGVTVCWQAHSGSHNSTEVSPNQAVSLMDDVQSHMNILHDKVFYITRSNWSRQPDFPNSTRRYIQDILKSTNAA